MIYLVDYENVKNLIELGELKETDKVIIFYTKNANTLTFEDHLAMKNTRAKIELKMVAVGNNALDFQLSTYLGYLIGKNEREFCVISKDNGYDSIIQFWKSEHNIQIEKRATFIKKETTGSSKEANSKAKKQGENLNKSELETVLEKSSLSLSKEDIKKVENIINQYKTKVAINSNLQKYFNDNEKVRTNIYKVLKPFLKGKS